MNRSGRTATLLAALAAAGLSLLLGAGSAHAIVDGRDASTSAYPWMVFLSRSDDATSPSGYFCGGALVAPTKVVTAAHCIDDLTPDRFEVVGGRTDLTTAAGTVRSVTSVWNAPKVPAPTPAPGKPTFLRGGDLSVLTLDRPMPYRTLPIADRHDRHLYEPGTRTTILGWGIYDEEGLPGPAPILQRAHIPMIDYATCNDAFTQHPASPRQLDPRFYVCGGDAAGGPAACGGDSGSPLVIRGRLAGVFGPVVSRAGMVCRNAFSGYTRVDVYADLIRDQLGDRP